MDRNHAQLQQEGSAEQAQTISLELKLPIHQRALDDGPHTPLSDSSQASLKHHSRLFTPSTTSNVSNDWVADNVQLTRNKLQIDSEKEIVYSSLIPLSESQRQHASRKYVESLERADASNSNPLPTHRAIIEARNEQKLQAQVRDGGKVEFSDLFLTNGRTKASAPTHLKSESAKSLYSNNALAVESPRKTLWGKLSNPFKSHSIGSATPDLSQLEVMPSKYELIPVRVESAKAAQILGTQAQNDRSGHRAVPSDGLYSTINKSSSALPDTASVKEKSNEQYKVNHYADESSGRTPSSEIVSVLKYYDDDIPPTPPSKDIRRQDRDKIQSRPRAMTTSSLQGDYHAKQQEYLAKYPVVHQGPFKRIETILPARVFPSCQTGKEPEMVQVSSKALTRGSILSPSNLHQEIFHDFRRGHHQSLSLNHLSMIPTPLNSLNAAHTLIDYDNTSKNTNIVTSVACNCIESSHCLIDHEPDNFSETIKDLPTMPGTDSSQGNDQYFVADESNHTYQQPSTTTAHTTHPYACNLHTDSVPDISSNGSNNKMDTDGPHSPAGIIFMAGQVFGALLTKTNNRVDRLSRRLDKTLKNMLDTTDVAFEHVHGRLEGIENRIEASHSRIGSRNELIDDVVLRLGIIEAQQERMIQMMHGIQRSVSSSSGSRASGGKTPPDLAQHPYYKTQG